MTTATIHAFNHNPQMASSAAACGAQGWRGPVEDVNCPTCLALVAVPVTITADPVCEHRIGCDCPY